MTGAMDPVARARHGFAACVHAAAFVALLVAARDVQPFGDYVEQFWYEGIELTARKWYYSCVGQCADEDKSFFVVPPRGATNVDVLGLGVGLPGLASVSRGAAAPRPRDSLRLRGFAASRPRSGRETHCRFAASRLRGFAA